MIDKIITKSSYTRIMLLWGTCGEELLFRRRKMLSPRVRFALRQMEHGGMLTRFGFAPTIITATVVIPMAVEYVANAINITTPPFLALGFFGYHATFLGTRIFPIRRNKRAILKKYKDVGRMLRRRQIAFYTAGMLLAVPIFPCIKTGYNLLRTEISAFKDKAVIPKPQL